MDKDKVEVFIFKLPHYHEEGPFPVLCIVKAIEPDPHFKDTYIGGGKTFLEAYINTTNEMWGDWWGQWEIYSGFNDQIGPLENTIKDYQEIQGLTHMKFKATPRIEE